MINHKLKFYLGEYDKDGIICSKQDDKNSFLEIACNYTFDTPYKNIYKCETNWFAEDYVGYCKNGKLLVIKEIERLSFLQKLCILDCLLQYWRCYFDSSYEHYKEIKIEENVES